MFIDYDKKKVMKTLHFNQIYPHDSRHIINAHFVGDYDFNKVVRDTKEHAYGFEISNAWSNMFRQIINDSIRLGIEWKGIVLNTGQFIDLSLIEKSIKFIIGHGLDHLPNDWPIDLSPRKTITKLKILSFDIRKTTYDGREIDNLYAHAWFIECGPHTHYWCFDGPNNCYINYRKMMKEWRIWRAMRHSIPNKTIKPDHI